MLQKGHTYRVFDTEKRFWGTVQLKWITDATISGYLEPSSSYSEIEPYFREVENALSSAENRDSGNDVSRFTVFLEDVETGENLRVFPVFVSETKLLSAPMKQHEI